MIKVVTVYRTKDKQFETLKEAIDHRENLVEKFFRDTPGFWQMSFKDRGEFVESILSRRKELIDLLSYNDKPEDLERLLEDY